MMFKTIYHSGRGTQPQQSASIVGTDKSSPGCNSLSGAGLNVVTQGRRWCQRRATSKAGREEQTTQKQRQLVGGYVSAVVSATTMFPSVCGGESCPGHDFPYYISSVLPLNGCCDVPCFVEVSLGITPVTRYRTFGTASRTWIVATGPLHVSRTETKSLG